MTTIAFHPGENSAIPTAGPREEEGKTSEPMRRTEGWDNAKSIVSRVWAMVKEFAAQYPAVLSGYIIYSYLFITIMRFFLKAKSRTLTAYEVYETFNALPFMWLLSSALVKIIDVRSKLHMAENEKLLSLHELEIRQAQLRTMQELARGFQHKINNPLGVIILALAGTKRAAVGNASLVQQVTLIETSAQRIKRAVIEFAEAEEYSVESAGGGMVQAVVAQRRAHPTRSAACIAGRSTADGRQEEC